MKKVSQVLVLKKIVNSTQTVPLTCDVVVVPLHKLFSLLHQTAIILKDKTQFLLIHTQKKISFQSFLFWEICKSRLYSSDVSTDMPILDPLFIILMMIAYLKKLRIFIKYAKRLSKNCELR